MRHRPFVVFVEWPNGKRVTLGFRDFNRAERYARNAARRGARSAVAVPAPAEIPTPALLPDRSGAPIGSPGARGPYFPGVSDFPILLLTADGAESFGGFARFTGALPGGIATDPLWDAKGDLAAATGPDAATRLAVGANGLVLTADSTQATGLKWAAASAVGNTSLVYRYTVAGSDKASIDTGVDTPDAGSNDWTNGDLLEIYLYSRTDEAVVSSALNLTLNNDTGNNYDQQNFTANNTSVVAAPSNARANWSLNTDGASAAANFFGTFAIQLPNYRGTVGYKQATADIARNDSAAANNFRLGFALAYRSTSAVTRLAVTPNTGGAKLKVGTQLLIYKRASS